MTDEPTDGGREDAEYVQNADRVDGYHAHEIVEILEGARSDGSGGDRPPGEEVTGQWVEVRRNVEEAENALWDAIVGLIVDDNGASYALGAQLLSAYTEARDAHNACLDEVRTSEEDQ